MSITKKEHEGLAKPLKQRAPKKACDARSQNLILGHIQKNKSIYPWMWDFGAEFDFIITSLSGNPIVKRKVVKDFLRTVHPDDLDDLTNELHLFSSSKSGRVAHRFRSDYLSVYYKWYELTGEAILDKDGITLKAIGVIQDANDRVNEHELIRENKKLLLRAKEKIEAAVTDRTIALKNLPTALVYVNKDYIVQWSSMETMKMVYGEQAYSEGAPCYQTTFGRDTPCKKCPVRKMFESQCTQTMRIQMKGEIIEVTVNPVYQGSRLIGGVLKLDKVTERVKQEQIIQNLNTLMDAILSNVPVSLFVKDPNDDFRYLYWNKTSSDLHQIPASKVIGHTDDEIFENKEEVERFRKNDHLVLETNSSASFIEECTSASGKTTIVNSLKTVIPRGKGQKPWILGISWDITEIKRTEKELIRLKNKAEESNRLKSSFLANMSHEIRTPLNAIVGFSELLCEIEDMEEKADYISIIRRNNHLLLQLVSDILDLSKIEADSLDLIYTSVDIYDLVSQVVAANAIEDSPIPVVLEQFIPDCRMYTDKNRVNQVLFNLINNALKFTESGEVRVGYYQVDENYVKFYVKDTGSGIDASKLDKIFERFIKLDSFKQGSGLGLSISQSIVEQLGGNIGVESEKGKGSCFWFVLPYDKRKKLFNHDL